MTTIIAYTHSAALHCPECTREDFRAGVTLRHPITHDLYDTGEADENGVGVDAVDRDGNTVRPVFSTDERAPGECCNDCLSPIS